MFPEIVLFGRNVTWYSIAVFIGVFAVVFFSMWAANKHGYDYYRMLCTVMFSFIGVGAGGALLYAIVNYKYIVVFFRNLDKITSFDMLVAWLGRIFGGSVFYGGML